MLDKVSHTHTHTHIHTHTHLTRFVSHQVIEIHLACCVSRGADIDYTHRPERHTHTHTCTHTHTHTHTHTGLHLKSVLGPVVMWQVLGLAFRSVVTVRVRVSVCVCVCVSVLCVCVCVCACKTVTHLPDSMSEGRRRLVRAKWPRWLMPN